MSATSRADQLLNAHLTRSQKREYRARRSFILQSKITEDRWYRVGDYSEIEFEMLDGYKTRPRLEAWEDARLRGYGIYIEEEGEYPLADYLLALKLALEACEREVLAHACG